MQMVTNKGYGLNIKKSDQNNCKIVYNKISHRETQYKIMRKVGFDSEWHGRFP